MSTLEALGQKLDGMGWTLVNMGDPVTGDPTPALDWQQLDGLVGDYEERIKRQAEFLEGTRLRISGLREFNLAQNLVLTQVWMAAGGQGDDIGPEPSAVVERVQQAIQDATTPREETEITDTLVNDVALGYFGPSVVYDREKMRSALANALQTR